MNFKRKFELHLDALLVISLLFFSSIGFNFFQLQQVKKLSQEASVLESKILVHELNLSAQQSYINKLRSQCEGEPGVCETPIKE